MTPAQIDARRPATIALTLLLAACAGQPELAGQPKADGYCIVDWMQFDSSSSFR